MIGRRSFMAGILAAGAAPALARAGMLMPVKTIQAPEIFWSKPLEIVISANLGEFSQGFDEFIELLRPETIMGSFVTPNKRIRAQLSIGGMLR